MKRPSHGIQSTTPTKARAAPAANAPIITFPTAPAPSVHSKDTSVYKELMPINGANEPHLIISKDEEDSIGNIFAFGAFADKNNGIVYPNLTRLFPFMSLDGSVLPKQNARAQTWTRFLTGCKKLVCRSQYVLIRKL